MTTTLADDLRTCIADVLGAPVPPAEGEPLRFYGQWLAERNLGLVPIAEAHSFAWPGKWLARVGDHAVVMYGSPSGPFLDPAGVYRDSGVEEGWLVAPIDLALPTTQPDADPGAGTVASILVAPAAEAPLAPVDRASALPGRGLEGDRYASGAGTFSGPGRGYELTLVRAEELEALGIAWELARRNVVTRGIDVNLLVGRRFRVGEVECVGRRLAEPCSHLERLSGPGLLRPLVHRAGLRADIVRGGTIRLGDEIVAVD